MDAICYKICWVETSIETRTPIFGIIDSTFPAFDTKPLYFGIHFISIRLKQGPTVRNETTFNIYICILNNRTITIRFAIIDVWDVHILGNVFG